MKTNQITFKVAKLDDSTAKAIGFAVTSDTAPAKEIGMTRDQLADLGFEGKLGQTLVLPNGKKQAFRRLWQRQVAAIARRLLKQ
jgi:hypothetical protein